MWYTSLTGSASVLVAGQITLDFSAWSAVQVNRIQLLLMSYSSKGECRRLHRFILMLPRYHM